MGTSHRQAPVRDLVERGARAASPSSSRCPTATRSPSATAAPPPSGRPPAPGWSASAPCTSPTASSRRSSPRRPPRRRSSADPIVVEAEPGDAPAPHADPAADAIGWAHNETSTGVMVPVAPPRRRRRRPGPDRRHLRRRRPAGRRRRVRRLLLRPAEGLRLRRRPLAGADQPGRDRPDRGARRRRRPLAARIPLAADRAGELAQGPDLQHAGAGDPDPARRPDRAGCSSNGGLDWCVAPHRGLFRRASTAGPRAPSFATPFVADPAKRSLVVGTIDFDDSVDAAALAKALRANGIVDVEPYRKLGRNQLRIGMFPAVEPADVEALTACIDWVSKRRRGGRADEGPGQGEDRRHRRRAAARELRRRPRPRHVRRGAREAIGDYDAILIRSATKMTPELIELADNLKVIGRAGTGVDNVDIPAATRRGIIVANAPESNSVAAAEHTLALALALFRNVPQAHATLSPAAGTGPSSRAPSSTARRSASSASAASASSSPTAPGLRDGRRRLRQVRLRRALSRARRRGRREPRRALGNADLSPCTCRRPRTRSTDRRRGDRHDEGRRPDRQLRPR